MIVYIIILIVFISIAILYAKMILIWRDTQLEQLKQIQKELEFLQASLAKLDKLDKKSCMCCEKEVEYSTGFFTCAECSV